MLLENKIFSVTELTNAIKNILEGSFPYGVKVEGEIRNYKHHSSGHRYFLLVDDDAQISCVIWRSTGRNLAIELKDGLHVELFGNLSVYLKSGRYQIYVNKITPKKAGSKALALEELKKKLKAEGLFDKRFKKPIPKFPRRVGVVTAKTGAAITDIIKVIRRRAPHIQIILRTTQVQGDGAADDIATAIKEFNSYGQVDVLIVGRGGGSQEDLWCFNEEQVARAIFGSEIPVVAAVGHEVDFSIADFVADLRAPTPSAAAELIAPDTTEIRIKIANALQNGANNLLNMLTTKKKNLSQLVTRYGFRKPLQLIYQKGQALDEISSSLNHKFEIYFQKKHNTIDLALEKINNLSPYKVLERGYSITLSEKDNAIITDANTVTRGDLLLTYLKDGKLISEVK